MSITYYRILGISERADISEIKSAYRRLAKKFHPDLNKSPDAQEKFILVNEAYEFLIKVKSQPLAYPGTGTGRHPKPEDLYNQWVRRERMKARARAAKEAKRKFDEFKKSSIYRTSQIIFTFYDYLSIGIGVMIIFATIIGLYAERHTKDGITISNIVAAVFLLFLGVMFILFSISSIKHRNKKAYIK